LQVATRINYISKSFANLIIRRVLLISIHTIQYRTRQTEAEQYIQEEYIKYSIKDYSKNRLNDKRMLATHKHDTVHEPEAE